MAQLVLIETASNQAYIFATNRQREQVGASELLARSTTSWLLDALPAGSHPLAGTGDQHDDVASLLDDPGRNPAGDVDVELLTVTSGKSLLVCRTPELAREVVAGVTGRALHDAPGLTVRGVTVPFGEGTGRDLIDAVLTAHRRMADVRAGVPTTAWRFQQDPWTAVCGDSGLPATELVRSPGGSQHVAVSASSAAKALAAQAGRQRMVTVLQAAVDRGELEVPGTADERDRIRRPAVLHADGNGIGALFAALGSMARRVAERDGGDAERVYVALTRQLSSGLDAVTRAALIDALAGTAARLGRPVQLLPLILGGDDVTAIVDGPAAWDLTVAFLAAFERHSSDRQGPLGPVLDELELVDGDDAVAATLRSAAAGLTAAGGFAVTGARYPFFSGYELAEAAVDRAKLAKTAAVVAPHRSASALDFHVHFDSTGGDLDRLRARRKGGEGAQTIELWGGPYLVLGEVDEQAVAAGGGWSMQQLRRRDAARLSGWRDALRPARGDDDDGPAGTLSRTTVRALRAALADGAASWASVRDNLRPEQAAELDELEQQLGPLVVELDGERTSVLLDVLELIGAEMIGDEPIGGAA